MARGADRLGVPDGAAIVLAVSGGPDSSALLVGAAAMAAQRTWTLTVAHVDHGLRADSATDAELVTRVAHSLGISCEVSRVDVRGLARAEHRSLEDAGRQARYRFLERVADARGPDTLIATAHTADDQAETVLLRLIRGTGLRGVRGIPSRRGRVVRPFLHERRADLRRLLDEAGVSYLVDPTNAVVGAAARNRVRAELLPVMERLNPRAIEAISRFAELAAGEDELLDALASAELAGRRGSGGIIDWRRPPPRALGRRVIRIAIGEPAPAAGRIEALLTAAEGPRGGLTIELGSGRLARVTGRRIRLE
jgi:tRNA(Ile)-lysidine synthase